MLKEADLISLSIPHMFRGHASCNNIGVAGKGPERGKKTRESARRDYPILAKV